MQHMKGFYVVIVTLPRYLNYVHVLVRTRLHCCIWKLPFIRANSVVGTWIDLSEADHGIGKVGYICHAGGAPPPVQRYRLASAQQRQHLL